MRNLGNTCYGNALLAALSRLPRLRGWLSAHTAEFPQGVQHNRLHCAICRLARDLHGLTHDNERAPLIPETMLYVAAWNPAFANRQQQDAEEAFQTLFAACDRCSHAQLRAHTLTPPDEALPHTVLDVSPYYQIFGGVYKDTIRCATCSCSTNRFEHFTTLQLDLLPHGDTLQQLIDSRFAAEACDRDYRCRNDRCHARGCHSKRSQIVRWPQVLVVHLKRWKYNVDTNRILKLDDSVNFPDTYSASPNVIHNLRSIVVHLGRAKSGHYIAYTRDDAHGWLCYDDAKTPKHTLIAHVLKQCPYMLVYEQAP